MYDFRLGLDGPGLGATKKTRLLNGWSLGKTRTDPQVRSGHKETRPQIRPVVIPMDSSLNYLTNKMCQMNTRVGCIARRQAHMASFALFPTPSPKASADENDDAHDDEDDASSSSDDKMTTSQ